MIAKQLIIILPVALLMLGSRAANAGETVDEAGAFACVTDKWNEKEVQTGHKLVDMAARCVTIPDNPVAPKYTTDCVGRYEFMPDESWKGSGTCIWNLKTGDKVHEAFEEGSHLKDYIYTITGGTGKYDGATGGGTYTLETLTDTLGGGRFKGKLELR